MGIHTDFVCNIRISGRGEHIVSEIYQFYTKIHIISTFPLYNCGTYLQDHSSRYVWNFYMQGNDFIIQRNDHESDESYYHTGFYFCNCYRI